MKYKIKEEYYNLVGKELHSKVLKLADWESNYNFTLNMLEEVYVGLQLSVVDGVGVGVRDAIIKYGTSDGWTDAERKRIQNFLNFNKGKRYSIGGDFDVVNGSICVAEAQGDIVLSVEVSSREEYEIVKRMASLIYDCEVLEEKLK
jgi:hypothetical protein